MHSIALDGQARNLYGGDMTLSITEFARLGGKARWKKVGKKKRSEMMSKVRSASKPKPWDIGNKP